MFSELSPPYAVIVADPPWQHDEGFPINAYRRVGDSRSRKSLAYSSMPVEEIRAMPVESIAAVDAHLYLWTTNRFLREAFGVVDAWGKGFE